jgi:hypothetical protein
MSAEEGANVLSRIKAGHDAEAILNHVKDGNLLMQLHLVLETRFRYELPYLKSMPKSLCVPGNIYLDSMVYEAASAGFLHSQPQPSTSSSATAIAHTETGTPNYQSLYLKPYHVAETYDPLLDVVQPSRWTNISKNDKLMRILLQAYLKHEYHSFAVFNKTYFFEDMASGATECCSSLLVNALLAYACVSELYSLKYLQLTHVVLLRWTLQSC